MAEELCDRGTGLVGVLFLSVLGPGELGPLRKRAASLSPGFPSTPLSNETMAQDLGQYPQWKAGWVS